MKLFWVIVGVILAYLLYLRVQLIKSRIKFNIVKSGLSDVKIDLSQILSLKGSIETKTKIEVVNNNNFNIRFSNLSLSLYYNNSLIGQFNDTKSILLLANHSTTFTEDIKINVNKSVVDLYSNIVAKNESGSNLKYIGSIKLFGIGFTFDGTYNALTEKTT